MGMELVGPQGGHGGQSDTWPLKGPEGSPCHLPVWRGAGVEKSVIQLLKRLEALSILEFSMFITF